RKPWATAPSGLLAHGILEGAYNRRQDRPTGAAADQLPDHGAEVDPAPCRALEGRQEQRQELPTPHTTEGTGNGVPGRAEADVLHACASGIAADAPGDELENEVDDGRRHWCPPRLGAPARCRQRWDGSTSPALGASARAATCHARPRRARGMGPHRAASVLRAADGMPRGREHPRRNVRALSIGLWSYVSRTSGLWRCRCVDAFRI